MIEQWKRIPGWSKYEASNLGRIRRIPGFTANGHRWKGKILSPGRSVVLCEGKKCKSELTSRMILFAFVGPPPDGCEACHADDDKTNNKLSNLRWDTHKANAQDALRNGLMHIGERSARAKLTERDVRSIRLEYIPGSRGKHGRGRSNNGQSVKGSTHWLAKKYGVDVAVICNIINHKSWRHVT